MNQMDHPTYRLAHDDERDEIVAFANAHGQLAPDFGVTFVARDIDQRIIAIANGGLVPYIETVISDSPVATVILFAKLEGALELNSIGPMLSTVNTDADSSLSRLGYKESSLRLFIKRRQ